MITKIKQPLKRFSKLGIALTFIAILMFSTLSSFITPGRAYGLSEDEMREQISQYSIYAAFSSCFLQLASEPQNKYDADFARLFDVSSNVIMYPTSAAASKWAGYGSIAEGSNKSNGTIDCEQITKVVRDKFGFSNQELLNSLNWQYDTRSSVWRVNGTNSTMYDKPITQEKRNAINSFRSLLATKGIPTSEPPYAKYLLAQAALTGGNDACNAEYFDKFNGPKITQDVKNMLNARDRNFVLVKQMTDDGYDEVVYKIPENRKDSQDRVPFPDPNNTDGEKLKKYCDELGREMYGDAYDKYESFIINGAKERVTSVYRKAVQNAFCTGGNTSLESPLCKDVIPRVVKECIDRNSRPAATGPGGGQKKTTLNSLKNINLDMLATCISNGSGLDKAKVLQALKNAQAEANGTVGNAPAQTGGGGTAANDPCASLPADTQLRWLACSVLSIANGIMDTLYGITQALLYTPVDSLFTDNLKKATDVFRNLALAIILISGLIMIIATAAGADIFDAYTVKKVLPRLGLALVGIAVCWPVLRVLVTLINDLGLMVGSFVEGLVGPVSQGGDAGTAAGGWLVAVGGGIGVVFALKWASLTYLVTGALALLMGLLILALRQMIIIVLVVLAPLAIASSVLPGTDKLWKFWRTTLLSVLMMFPILMLFLKSGVFLSRIMASTSLDSNLKTIMSALIFFAPYFMVPITFKMAGGLIGNIAGMVNDRSKGAFDRLKNVRGNARKQNMKDFRQGNYMRGNSGFARGINRVGTTFDAFASKEVGLNPYRWQDQVRSAKSRAALNEAEDALQNNAHVKRLKSNDDYMTASITYDNTSDQIRFLTSRGYSERQAREAAATIRSAKHSMSNEGFENAMLMALPATGTYARSTWNEQEQRWEGGKAQMDRDILRVSRGDMNRADTLLAMMRQSAQGARRMDLAGGSYGDDRTMLHGLDSGAMTDSHVTRQSIANTIKANGAGTIASVRGNTAAPVAQVMTEDLQQTMLTHGINSPEFQRQLASVAGLYDALGQTSPENAEAFATTLMSNVMPTTTENAQQMIERYRSNEDFVTMRREYQSSYAAQAAQMNQLNQQQQQQNPQAGGQPGPTP